MKGNYEEKPKTRKSRKIKRFKRKLNRFVHNKYCIIGTYILICFICCMIGRGCQASADKNKYDTMLENKIAEISAEYEASINQLNEEHNKEISKIKFNYENPTPEELIKEEAEYIAKVLYGTALNHDERDQRTLVWCILNRVDSAGYPGDVKSVCQQPSQWIGYDDDNPILNNLYDIAMTELETWHNNYRPVNKDYVFMSWSSNEISLRDTYEKKPNTRYWRAG